MLDLHKVRSPAYSLGYTGRNVELPSMSPQTAKIKAAELLTNGLYPSLERVVDLLSVGGVMSVQQLGVSPRTLRKHREKRVADPLPFATAEIVSEFAALGLPVPKERSRLRLFALGPVGIEIVKMRHEVTPPTGYFGYPLERVIHDVVVNEIVLRIAQHAMAHGWRPIWVSEQEAALYQGNQQILKPDALLRLRQGEQEVLFLIEYHNEDHGTRAADKVRKYERAYASELWKEAWETKSFPPILAAFREPIVGRSYQEVIDERESVRCTFFGRHLHSALTDTGNWFNFTTRQREYIFPWPDGNVESEQAEDGTRNGAPAEK